MDAIKRVISGEDFDEKVSLVHPSSTTTNNNNNIAQNNQNTLLSVTGEDGRKDTMEIDHPPTSTSASTNIIRTTDKENQSTGSSSTTTTPQPPLQQEPLQPRLDDENRPLANLVENDVDVIMIVEGSGGVVGGMPDEGGQYHYLTSAQSETPRSSLSDMSAAQRLEEDTMEGHAGDSDGLVESSMNQRDEDVAATRRMVMNPPLRALSRMHSLQHPPQQGSSLHDWESGMRIHTTAMTATGSTTTVGTPDRNWDESSSVGRTGNSQTSSRDWGWFEDVHGSDRAWAGKESPPEDGPNSSKDPTHRNTTNNIHNKNNKRSKNASTRAPMGLLLQSQESLLLHRETLEPLVQRDLESDAAAMAVTAPNYVLEESLSSQRLWKYTAGQRPPQPMEERAFFEKMWAQNFARSQVEYQMPVEVLTATTPISLNPFADINFVAESNELSHYNLEDATESAHHHHNIGQSSTKKPNPSDVAEAALMRKLNEPARVPLVDHHEGGQHAHLDSTQKNRPSHHHHQQQQQVVKNDGGDTLTVLVKGDNVFGTTVSKSFARPSEYGGLKGVDTVNISVASYRVVESKKHGKYAQFLVIYREGSIRDTLGVWKRYSDFDELSRKVTQAHEGCAAVMATISPLAIAEEHEVEHLPNAITSWRLLKKRKRWYRCLDAGYLSLKVFLLERFLHDILFESSSPDLLRDFVGVAQPRR